MRRAFASGITYLVALLVAPPVFAHHSAAAFDTQQEVKTTGTITKYEFRNPHIYITLQVKKADGSTAPLEVEAGAASVLNGVGFTKGAIKVGDVVTIVGNPARRNPEALMLGRDLYKTDGTYLPLNIASRSVYAGRNEVAASIAGTWFSPFPEFTRFLGGTARWPVTEAGKTAMGKAGPTTTTQKDCVPIGAPALMFYPVANTITVQRDRVVMKVDWMDSERVVYLDGRQHPPANQTSLLGHSVGHWEGETLVVETTNFAAHPNGLSNSLPSSAQKKLVERLTLTPDKKGLAYSGVVDDPVYLTRPVEWSGTWQYRPNMPHSNEKCNVGVARKFLDDLK